MSKSRLFTQGRPHGLRVVLNEHGHIGFKHRRLRKTKGIKLGMEC